MPEPGHDCVAVSIPASNLGASQAKFELVVQNRQRRCPINMSLLRRIITTLLDAQLKITSCRVGVYLVSASKITHLNRTYLHRPGLTDVIAFDYGNDLAARVWATQSGETDMPKLWGDIFVCADAAVRQARQFNTTWQAELVRYIIHGVLHLLGYKDHSPAARRKMKKQEDKILKHLMAMFKLDALGLKTSCSS